MRRGWNEALDLFNLQQLPVVTEDVIFASDASCVGRESVREG